MFTGKSIADLLGRLGVTDVVTVPDSTVGAWGDAAGEAGIRVVRVCREGEAWGVAAGLRLGGRRPLVLIQCTGLFESGDALRNVLHDWRLPIPAIIGYRSYLNQETLPGDTCLVFTEPVAAAWQLDTLLVTDPGQQAAMERHLAACLRDGRPGAVLVAEGKA